MTQKLITSRRTDNEQNRKRIHATDAESILIVAPYNVQVAAISERLPGSRAGTVERFQGHGAPVVIYSMMSSSSDKHLGVWSFSTIRIVSTSRLRGPERLYPCRKSAAVRGTVQDTKTNENAKRFLPV